MATIKAGSQMYFAILMTPPPMSDEEMQEWDEGGDPCSFHVKVNELH